MKKKPFLLVFLLSIAVLLPLLAINAQGDVDAGPDQQVYTGQTTSFNGTTTENITSIIQVTWNFGDNTTAVNGTSSELLNATHIYTTAGIYNATLTVKFNSALNKTESAIATITVIENTPPTADAGPDQTVEQTSQQGAYVTLNGTGSSDPNNDTLTFYWNWTENSATGATTTALFPVGNTTVTLTVTDGQLNATDTVNIVVKKDETAPIVNAGPDVTVEQESPAGTQVTLNGTATNTVSTRFNFTWSENGTLLKTESNVTNTVLMQTFSQGTHVVTLNATDEAGNTGSDNVTVTVVDTTPPEIMVSVTPGSLWPPNHKYVQIEATVTTEDAGDTSPTITFVSITSNEPDNGKGDGNTINDIAIIDNYTFELRAERSGNGEGRVYTITYQATDSSGNTAQSSATVTVTHNP